MSKKIIRVRYDQPLYIVKTDEYEFPDKMIKSLEPEYSNVKNWLYKKVLPELNELKRSIIYLRDENDSSDSKYSVKACLILKNTSIEKKICTIWINTTLVPESEYEFIISLLVDKAIKELKIDLPLVTLSSKNKYFNIYEKVFNDHGFILMDVKNDYYVKGDKEYCYNGVLE